ncbi:MAG: ROK family protein [Ilumatobacteraceae bacterium]|nr:ROK family protein [Ilumatobacteraceae bacterium]
MAMDVAIGIDIGGTKFSVGVVSRQGELLDRETIAVNHSLKAEELFADLGAVVQRQIARARDHHKCSPVVVGVGSAGPIEHDVVCVSPLNIGAWIDFPLRQKLIEVSELPVFGDGDAKALALAEGWLGAANGCDNFMVMVVSTGVGAGIVLNGELLSGVTGNAGHVGHIVVEPNGRRCACGGRGCLEAEASGIAIEAITGRSPTQSTYETMQRTGRLVGQAAASVCNFLDLDLVVVGGGVAVGFGATFFLSAQQKMDELCRLDFSRKARIIPVQLGSEGGLIGAAAVGWRGINRQLNDTVAQSGLAR